MFVIDGGGTLSHRTRRPTSAYELESLGDCLWISENRTWGVDEADAIWQAMGLYDLIGVRDADYSQAWLMRRAREHCRTGVIDLTADPDPIRITLELDRDLVEALRASGLGWRRRINTALRSWLDLDEAAKPSWPPTFELEHPA